MNTRDLCRKCLKQAACFKSKLGIPNGNDRFVSFRTAPHSEVNLRDIEFLMLDF